MDKSYYNQFIGTTQYYRRNGDNVYVYTDGVKALAENEEAQWMIDFVRSYISELRNKPFQVFNFKKNSDESMDVFITDGNENELAKQHIEYTDFPFDEFTFWCIGGKDRKTILLPSEY